MLTDRVSFGPYTIDSKSGELWRDGVSVPLQDLPFRLLSALVERPGELVTRSELTQRLWGSDTYVDSTAGLNTAVAKLRDALGDNADQPLYVETVPKRGYRFIGSIAAGEANAADDDRRATLSRLRSSDATASFGEARRSASGAEAAGSRPAGARGPEWPALRPIQKRPMVWVAAACVVVALASLAIYQLRAGRPQTRVAVILFDNETGRPEVSRLSQALTDATVFALTAQPKLAVIGNAAILRSARAFRDIAAVRDALHADFIVIGQVQLVDDRILVRSHLIRAGDQAHVWVNESRLTGTEAALQAEVASRIASAVGSRVP
jgi:DNA-binding winged helix-turn-helix (wHTH) protein/TolB-like protein